MSIKAALLTEINQPLVITGFDYKLLPGQVLVRVLVSGICGAQLQEICGEKGTHFPRMLGHEACGIVAELGPGVTKVKLNEKVVMHWRKGSGMESAPPQYRFEGWGDEVFTSGQVTTFSEFSVCSENRLTAVPSETPNELCALLGCGLSTALGVMENEARLKAGESVLIVGCGGVGLNLIRVARLLGAGRIVAHDRDQVKLVTAINMGADYQRFGLKNPNDKSKFDIVVDTTGNADVLSAALRLLGPSGRLIMVGQPPSGVPVVIENARHLFDGEGKRIIATQGGGFNPDQDIPRVIRMWKNGHLQIDGVITHRYPFEKINEAIELVQSGSSGRVMLEMV